MALSAEARGLYPFGAPAIRAWIRVFLDAQSEPVCLLANGLDSVIRSALLPYKVTAALSAQLRALIEHLALFWCPFRHVLTSLSCGLARLRSRASWPCVVAFCSFL